MEEAFSADKDNAASVIALALIASSEEVGNEMAMRLVGHMLHFDSANKKTVIPIALAILSLSNAKINVVDLLVKLAYDVDNETSQIAIMCLGMVGAGTNNSRLADIFRKLASYHNKEQ